MAFDKSLFSVDGTHFNSNVVRRHSYTTVDTQADVNTSGYFNNIAAELSVGDFIDARVDTDGTPANVVFYVASNDGTTVDVTDGVVATATDTD